MSEALTAISLPDRATVKQYTPAALHALNAVLLVLGTAAIMLILGAEGSGLWLILFLFSIVMPVGVAALGAVLFAIAWARLSPAVAPKQGGARAVGVGTAVGQILLFVAWLSTLDLELLYNLAIPYGILWVMNIGALVSCWR